ADLQHVVAAPRIDVVAVGVLRIFVAAARPVAEEGTAALRAIVPVGGGVRRSGDLQFTLHAAGDRVAGLIDDPQFVTRHRLAGSAIANVVGAIGQVDVQHLGRADAVENVDAEALGPAPRDLFGERLAGRRAAAQRD